MKGARDLDDSELKTLKEYFDNADRSLPENKHIERDKCFIWLGFWTGWRASELLQIKISDVYDGHKILDYITIKKNAVKGKTGGKSAPIYDDCKTMLLQYIKIYCTGFTHLFQSSQGVLTYRQMLRCVKKHFDNAGFTGKNLSTHTLRKTFSRKMFSYLDGNLVDLQSAMGHKSISSTVCYVSCNREKITNGIKNLKF